ncbi:MAG: ADP-ribosylglycohydrolase family protein, partial [Planctomycetota bacterium]
QYTPALPEGARTDDDTDLEWVYISAIERSPTLFLAPRHINALWTRHVNEGIWCANRYARALMDLGIEPPLTGHVAVNPWSDFNVAGQFVCESFGLIAPGMPQTAARIGLHYTRVTIDGEPAQTTQLFTSMIAEAFLTNDLERILDAGAAAVDPGSEVHRIVADVRQWRQKHPDDPWATRRLLKEKYSRHDGTMRDQNGYELNTASTIAALLYGEGDFVETLRTAFNFGWDADNNAATAGTIIGVIRGHAWMQAQGWQIADRYRNTTRPGMPEDETITRFAGRLIAVADRVILERGGQKTSVDGQTVYRIRREAPANVAPLADAAEQFASRRAKLKPEIEAALTGHTAVPERARAVYLAICFDLAEPLRRQAPEQWAQAVAALNEFPDLLRLVAESPTPAAAALRKQAAAVGVETPGDEEAGEEEGINERNVPDRS